MIEVNFCRAPSHMWVGWVEYENGLYYSSGKTMDDLVYHIKINLYQNKRVSARQIIIASHPSDQSEVPLDRMGQMFKTKFWYEKGKKYNTEPKPKEAVCGRPVSDYDYYDFVEEDGVVVVYGVKKQEVARYKTNPAVVSPFITMPVVSVDSIKGDDDGEGPRSEVL